MITRRRVLYITTLLVFFGVIIVAPALTMFVWTEEPDAVIRATITDDPVEAGGVLRVKGFVKPSSRCELTLIRRVFDASGVLIASTTDIVMPTIDTIPVESYKGFPIHREANVGEATLNRVLRWRCNWTQQVFPRQRQLDSLEFTIVAPK